MDDPMQYFEGSSMVGNTPTGACSRPERVWARLQAGPLAAIVEELIQGLSDQRYAPTTQMNLARAAVRLGGWMLAENLILDNLDQVCVMRMVQEDNARAPKHCSANQNVSAVFRFLNETGDLRPERVIHTELRPAQACLDAWVQYLEVEQGQGASWLGKARKVGEAFFKLIEGPSGELCWERVDVAVANDFLQRAVAGYSSSTAQSTAALLRGFLSWAAANGWVNSGVAFGVLSPRRIRSDLPKGLNSSEVAALKSAVDLQSRTGRRDMAVIVMLARLGVRAGEVAGLTLEDINWRDPSLQALRL